MAENQASSKEISENVTKKNNFYPSSGFPLENKSRKGLISRNSTKANRGSITDAFHAFGQLMAASSRPLPTQNGDGTYSEEKKRPSFKKDLKTLSIKG